MLRRGGSIRLFDIFGLRVGADASWFLVLFLMIFALSGPFRTTLHSSDGVAYLTTVVSVLLLFGSLTVHELGHALVARRQGIEVKRIDLFLFGGLTQMSRDAASPAEDFKIAIAGPLATLAMILLCLALDVAMVGTHRLLHAVTLRSDIRITPILLSLSWLLSMNVLLFAFNLLPAFPLDGGRVTRSAVWRVTGNKWRATAVAARLGQVFALIVVAVAVAIMASYGGIEGLWLLALAYLLWQAARAALAQAAVAARLDGVLVSDIMDAYPISIEAQTGAAAALDEYFRRYHAPWFPVVDEEGRLVAIVGQAAVQTAVDAGEGWLAVGSLADREGVDSLQIRTDRPIAELLASESMARLGALIAVDREGVLRGVVTAEQARRALSAALERSPA
jgi:Zn-dependent protease